LPADALRRAECEALAAAPRRVLVGERRADDSGFVLQLRRDQRDLLRYRESGQELRRLPADPTPDDDEIGPEVALQRLKVGIDPARPFLPGQIFAPARARRRTCFRLLSIHLEVAELAVRYEMAVDEQRRSDPRSERDQDHETRPLTARTEGHLGVARGVGVVNDRDAAPRSARKKRPRVGPDPAAFQVRSGQHDAFAHGRGNAAANRPTPSKVAHEALDRARYRTRRGRLGRIDPVTRCEQLPRAGLDRRALDAAAADVDAEHLHADATFRAARARAGRTRRSGAY